MANRRSPHPVAGAQEFLPDSADLGRLAEAVQDCRGCELYRDATQAVFGRGAPHARVLLLGEQPGDQEDRRGQPFVGPAGAVLRRALDEVGLGERDVYLTNAVKHFRWHHERDGKRRIHQRPDAGQVAACRPWWVAEVTAVEPRVLVALGATAGQALFGASFRVGATRGTVLDWPVPGEGDGARTIPTVPTIHPSAVLRAPDRDEAYAGLVADLGKVRGLLHDD